MPHLDHTGPEGKGPKIGRKLGKCAKSEAEEKESGQLGVGMGKRHHAGGDRGKGKRLQYDKNKK